MPFKQDTNWVVITGAPSSGKTSVVNELRKRGYPVEEEVARELIELGLQRGCTLDDIRGDAPDLQRHILGTAFAREEALKTSTLTFLDRGLPDSITYCRLAGIETEPARFLSQGFRYRAVFIFERLPLEKDGVRLEDDALATRIDRELEEDYRALGYDPIRVPVMPIADRADFILKTLDAQAPPLALSAHAT